MNTNTITQDTLATLTGYKSACDIAACLARQGIPYFQGKRGRIFTTVSAFEVAMGIKDVPTTQTQEIEVL